jgi:hypothetical protein
MKDFTMKVLTVLVVVLVVVSIAALRFRSEDDGGPGGYTGPLPPVGSMEVPFVLSFTEPEYVPSPPTYVLPLDLETVNRLEEVGLVISLSPEQMDFLRVNGMVGVRVQEEGFVKFYEAYEWLEETHRLPTFVTSDSMLDAYHLLFEKTLRDIEHEYLHDQLRFMCRRMMTLCDQQADELDGKHRQLAEQNVVFFAVGLRLLDEDAPIPSYAEDQVEDIVDLINDASGWTKPPGFEQKEDFTQYEPRGHYTSSGRLTRYFKAMMWFGRMTLKGSDVDETRRALLLSTVLTTDKAAASAYTRISSVLRFIVGAPDDLTPLEYAAVVEDVSQNGTLSLSGIISDNNMDGMMKELGKLRRPRILSEIAFPWERDETWGLRLFGQGFVYDSYIFQRGVYDAVEDRFMPSAIDVMAVLGSKEAWSREPFDAFDPAFKENMVDLRDEVRTWDEEDWGDDLYNAWLYSLQSLHQDTPARNVPAFMGTPAWDAKQLNTQMASWTQLTHDTLLYRKQSYTYYMGIDPFTNFTYVEPVPELYSRLADMVNATVLGLRELSLLSHEVEGKLTAFENALGSMERVAVCELTGEQADEDDVWACRKAYEITTWELTDGLSPPREGELFEAKTVVVSDVHTDPNYNEVLQEGVGYVALMMVVVPSEYGPVACVGPVFEHHEFVWPMADRLTDEDWKEMLDDGTAPEPAPWAQDFNP